MDNSFVRGSISGLITCGIIQPMDVIKTNILTLHRSSTISESFQYIHNKFGPIGFWRGVRPAAYKAVLGAGMTFSFLETLKSLIPTTHTNFALNTILAMISRGSTIVLVSPLSIIKVRMEAPHAVSYSSVTEGIKQIYHQEGFKGYYRGLTSCLLRDLPFAGLAYGFYELFADFISNLIGTEQPSLAVRGFSAGLGGFAATLMTQPFDVIKTRQQFSHIGEVDRHKYRGISDALKKIYINEGIRGFTVGLSIRLIERSTGYGSVWLIYEALKSYSK